MNSETSRSLQSFRGRHGPAYRGPAPYREAVLSDALNAVQRRASLVPRMQAPGSTDRLDEQLVTSRCCVLLERGDVAVRSGPQGTASAIISSVTELARLLEVARRWAAAARLARQVLVGQSRYAVLARFLLVVAKAHLGARLHGPLNRLPSR